MTLVEEMDRTLKAWVRDYGDFNPEALPVLALEVASESDSRRWR